MFRGSIPALVTPFRDGAFDEAAFTALVERQIEAGSAALVPVGTTGESPTLSHEEHHRVVELCVRVAAGRVPVIAGTGSNATAEAIDLTRHAEAAGADAALVVTPYYNKPSQEGLFQHFKAIHDATRIPIILYNIPGRSVIDLDIATTVRLAGLPRIVGIKDATADLARPLRLRTALSAAHGPERADSFAQLSGEDITVAAFLAQGGVGCISVTANVAPAPCAALHAAWARGDMAELARLRDLLAPLHHALFMEPSPAPVKHALARLGQMSAEVRAPLLPVGPATAAAVDAALVHAGLLSAADA